MKSVEKATTLSIPHLLGRDAFRLRIAAKESEMTSVKLIVAYPQPADAEAFEKLYLEEHVPLAVAKLHGMTKIVATKILESPPGKPQFYRVAEVVFPSSNRVHAWDK